MRRRSLSHRAATAVLWIWFAAFFAAPPAWRPCPMHVAAEAAPEREVAGSHGAHSAHGVHGPDTAAANRSAPAEPAPAEQAPAHPCDCATDCCGAPALA